MGPLFLPLGVGGARGRVQVPQMNWARVIQELPSHAQPHNRDVTLRGNRGSGGSTPGFEGPVADRGTRRV
jgi:hypothetical protein